LRKLLVRASGAREIEDVRVRGGRGGGHPEYRGDGHD
jgi:hypothetical protein